MDNKKLVMVNTNGDYEYFYLDKSFNDNNEYYTLEDIIAAHEELKEYIENNRTELTEWYNRSRKMMQEERRGIYKEAETIRRRMEE